MTPLTRKGVRVEEEAPPPGAGQPRPTPPAYAPTAQAKPKTAARGGTRGHLNGAMNFQQLRAVQEAVRQGVNL